MRMNEQMEKRLRRRVLIAIVVITILVILSIWQAGCGKMMRGTRMIIEGFGDGATAAGEHLQKSTSRQ